MDNHKLAELLFPHITSTPEEIEAQIKKQLKMDGLVNSDLEVVEKLDRQIEGESDVIPVVLKSGMIQEARSSVASGKRFGYLREYVRSKCRTAGQEILKGKISLRPMKQGTRTGCDYCPYHAVCGFDRKTAGFGYRKLKALKPEEIWKEIIPKARCGLVPLCCWFCLLWHWYIGSAAALI